MANLASFERCLSYIDCHLQGARGSTSAPRRARMPAVTISRQVGAGGIPIAEELADLLNARRPPDTSPWTVFDKNLVQKALEDHDLPARLAQFMPEDKGSNIADAVEELLGLHPPSGELVRQTTETILRLAELGHVILVGRGSAFITARLEHVVHVRLVGSVEARLARVREFYHLDSRAARELLEREDTGRARYLRKYFQKDINDPLLYHLTINTDRISDRDAAAMIALTVLEPRSES